MKIDEDHHFKMYETQISRLFLIIHCHQSVCLFNSFLFVVFLAERKTAMGTVQRKNLRLRVTPPPNAIAAQALF